MVDLNDQNIQALFGVEDAENEDPNRLKQYFLRNKAYENLVIGLPIRILVGHKGVGKSALLKVAFMEDQSNDQLAIWLQPDDLRTIAASKNEEMNTLIKEWKDGIINVIYSKILENHLSSYTKDHNIPASSIKFRLIHAFTARNTGFSGRNSVWLMFTASEDKPHTGFLNLVQNHTESVVKRM